MWCRLVFEVGLVRKEKGAMLGVCVVMRCCSRVDTVLSLL